MDSRLSSRLQLLAVLLVGRLADTATTLYGLRQPGVHERNPVPAALIGDFGPVLGLVVANAVAVLAIVTAVEVGASAFRRADRSAANAARVRAAGYLTYAVISFGAAAYNVRVLAAAASSGAA